MNLEDVACQISDLLESNRSLFFRTEPEVLDHTLRVSFKVLLCGLSQRLELEVTPEEFVPLVALLDATVFSKDCVDRLYTWDLKSFCTYFHAACPQKFFTPSKDQSVIDLKPIERFLGNWKKAPENLAEAINRTKLALHRKGWLSIYKAVHLPLSLRVLPSIETTPLLHDTAKRAVFPYYEIEGTISGRMNTLEKFSRCYVPHRLGPEDRKNLKPRGYGYRFMCSDFRFCEIAVLQWLSGDQKLRVMLDSGGDVYAQIYRAVTGDECNTDKKRDMAKAMMISVMYGSGATRLSETLVISEGVAKVLIARIRIVFKTACDWMAEQRDKAKMGVFEDYFGRPRDFTAEPYKAPDIMIQGVAATVCQEKLIDLYSKMTNTEKAYIGFSVHDGLWVILQTSVARDTYRLVKDVLEKESTLCPGLAMKVKVKFGARMDGMKELWKD